VKRIIIAAVVALLLTGCVTYRDPRTQNEIDRDAEIWTRAHSMRVTTHPDLLRDCSSLGVVSERYYEGPPGDPLKRPMGAAWPEYILRFKTAQLGGDAALVCPAIRRWSGELNETRVLGEAYLCGQPVLTAASH
jgi:putative VirB-like lipoprotein